jgi:hypothetical protein
VRSNWTGPREKIAHQGNSSLLAGCTGLPNGASDRHLPFGVPLAVGQITQADLDGSEYKKA